MFLMILSAILAAISLYQFILELIKKKFSLKNFIIFLILLIFCFVIYFSNYVTDESNSESNDIGSSVETHTSPQLSDNSSNNMGTSSDASVSDLEDNPTFSSPNEENDDSLEESVDLGKPFVEITPQSQVNSANIYAWDKENDRDIIGNTYPTAIKLTVSNTIDVLFGYGESNISADVHFPFGEKATGIWRFSFVAAQEMVGNGSSAEITILADGKELYPAFTLTSSTTEDLTYEITLDEIRDLVLHFECKCIGNGFYAGIVLDDSVE